MALLRRNLQVLLSKALSSNTPVCSQVRRSHGNVAVKEGSSKRPEGRTKCTLIPGDGVGPELVHCVMQVFEAAGVPVDFETFFFSEVYQGMSAPLEDVAKSITNNGICIKAPSFRYTEAPSVRKTSDKQGALAIPDYSATGELQSLNTTLKKTLDLYANVVHIKTLPGLKFRHTGIDLVLIREQTEGEYSALEHESVPGVVECLKIVTAAKSERIAKFAFDYATRNNRKKVTAVHKANIMKLGDGLFLKSCREMAALYPRIKFESMIVDNCTMQMVSNPQQFDVLVTPNLYGNILDNLASGLVGGAGITAGASYSSECVVFEPGAKHTYSEAVGKNVANPTAMLLCGAKMLYHINLNNYGDMLRNAISSVLQEGKVRTKDVGGQSTTSEYVKAIISHLKQ